VSNNHENDVSVIDTANNAVIATIPVQSSPFGLVFTPDGTQVYVVNGSSNTVSIVDTASRTVVATVPVGVSPVGVAMALTSNGTFAYVTNSISNTVSVITVGNAQVTQTIPVGSGPRWVAVAPNSSLAYVENANSNNVSVISVASNTVTSTIAVGLAPFGAAFSPDSSLGYVANSASNTLSVIATASSNIVSTVTGFNDPVHVAVTSDGSSVYVTNLNANTVSVVATASNTITGTVAVGAAPIGVSTAAAPPTTLIITLPLSPTLPNDFNFGTNNQVVQYPPGTMFSGISMTTEAVQITQAELQQRLSGTPFANASCVIYAGSGGNCTDYEVTCTDTNGQSVPCPSEDQPTIAVQTGFTTSGSIVNPGYLTTPIGLNQWENIFTGFTDPTVKGKTKGFSEFVAVSLGASNPQGLANFRILTPRITKTFKTGAIVHVKFQLTSVANGTPVTDAQASIAVTRIANANGQPTSVLVFSRQNAFRQTVTPGIYKFAFSTQGDAAGTYSVTIYGNAFPMYQFQFKLVP
jgi:YVTN family beta-propeller protein